jgi:hypothetical protein
MRRHGNVSQTTHVGLNDLFDRQFSQNAIAFELAVKKDGLSQNDIASSFHRSLSEFRFDIASILIEHLKDNTLAAVMQTCFSNSPLPEVCEVFGLKLQTLLRLGLAPDLLSLKSASFLALVNSAFSHTSKSWTPEVVNLVLCKCGTDPSCLSLLNDLDLSVLHRSQIDTLLKLLHENEVHLPVNHSIIDWLFKKDKESKAIVSKIENCIEQLSQMRMNTRLPSDSDEIPIKVIDNAFQRFKKVWKKEKSTLSNEMLITKKQVEDSIDLCRQTMNEIERLKTQIGQLEALIPATLSRENTFPLEAIPALHRDCHNILRDYLSHCVIESFPTYELDDLRSLLLGSEESVWWSEPNFSGFPVITVRFVEGIETVVIRYSLQSGLRGMKRWPYLRNWTLYGRVSDSGEWKLLDEHTDSNVLSDGEVHTFSIQPGHTFVVNALRLCQTGRNGLGSRQMYLKSFVVCGDVFHPREMYIPSAGIQDFAPSDHIETVSVTPVTSESRDTIASQSVIEDTPIFVAPDIEESVVDSTVGGESVIIPESLPFSEVREDPVIHDLTTMEFVQVLRSSRFGSVHLLKSGLHYYTAKYYNVGHSRESAEVFLDFIGPFLSFSHPYVMPILKVIPPTKTQGPIVITGYSKYGSLADVLTKVHLNNPPDIWNNTTKLRMIISMVLGLTYLHNQKLVHQELKPTDLIVQDDGSIRICGYLTNILEQFKYIQASEVGTSSYMAPEIYDKETATGKTQDPKTDVFSFGLILYELLCGGKVFPTTSSAATIMRKAMSNKPRDRPVIPRTMHPLLREIISLSWNATPSKRPTFDWIWQKMREIQFQFFEDATVNMMPLDDIIP